MPENNNQLATLPTTNICGNCGARVADDMQFCPKCGARSQSLQSVQELFEQISEEMRARLNAAADSFTDKCEVMVKENVERITAPLTTDALNETVRTIAKGMVEQYSTQNWRVKELIQEALDPHFREHEILARRLAAVEKALLFGKEKV